MDAFYASVELLRYPELRGLPVVIGGSGDQQPVLEDGRRQFLRLKNYAGRGVITTATYEARVFGVSSGMGLMKAAQLVPHAILLPADFHAYRHYSRLFKAAVASVAPKIEDHGIDEIYIDLSGLPGDTLTIARNIKQAVGESTGLSCSIGVTPNKLLSKICSDLEKPDGLTILDTADIPDRIWPLPVRKINGIVRKPPRSSLRSGSLLLPIWGRQTLSFYRRTLAAAMGNGCMRPRTASMTGPWLRNPNPDRSAGKRPSNAISIPAMIDTSFQKFLRSCARTSRMISATKAMPAVPSASSCVMLTSAP